MSLASAWPGETGSRNFVAARYRLVWLVAAVYWGVSGATRAVLAAKALAAGQVGHAELPGVFGIGASLDLFVALAVGAPFALYHPATRTQTPAAADDEGVRDAASLYQVAYGLYLNRRYRAD